MVPKVSEEHMLERRNQILDAAVMTFSRNGFHQTTIEDIRVASGLSRGAIYHYFKSKEDILDGIRERSLGQADDFYDQSQGNDDAATRLMDLVIGSFAVMTRPESVESNRLGVYLWAESLVNPRIMDGQLISFAPYLDILAKDVKVMQSEGKIDEDLDALAVARVIAGTVLGLQIQLTWEPDGVDMNGAKKVLSSMLTGSFRNNHS
jgi:AcrR family transcriptional regulator